MLLKFFGATTYIPVISLRTSQTISNNGPEYSSFIPFHPISSNFYLVYLSFNSSSKSFLNYITKKLYAVYPYLNGFSNPITKERFISSGIGNKKNLDIPL